ncbi:MAG: galactose-6-phosphate isomerase, partial [Streptococcus sp.]
MQKIKQRRMIMAIIIGADAAGSKLKDV